MKKKLWSEAPKGFMMLTVAAVEVTLEKIKQVGPLWALLYRFGYFIDCAGSQLPVSCYQTMQNDLVTRKYIIFALAEPESSLVTKEAYLQKVIMSGLAKAEAAEKGIFVGELI